MDNNIFATRDVMDVYIFDENGNYVISLDHLYHSKIFQECDVDRERCYLVLDSQIYNMELLSYIYGNSKMSEYEKYLQHFTKTTFDIPGNIVNKKCKFLATGYFKSAEEEIIDYVISAENATLKYGFSIKSGFKKIKPYDIVIELDRDKDNNFYQLHMIRDDSNRVRVPGFGHCGVNTTAS